VSGAVQVPREEQTIEFSVVFPKQIGYWQFVPLYPVVQLHESISEHIPCPEHTFASLKIILEQLKASQYVP